ncbi:MAG: hypothetical protein IPP90_23040 [Gemmatimonadaceae bacterium]|nr:hypothetical protein [Gemmatimonadaceae bacterium]
MSSDELRDLLDASVGVNVGFELLEAARKSHDPSTNASRLEVAASVLWLDVLVQNLDRSPSNPNIMCVVACWLIDHGAALPFHHDWSAVRGSIAPYDIAGHVFGWADRVVSRTRNADAAVCARRHRRGPCSGAGDVAGGLRRRRGAAPRDVRVPHLRKRLHWMAATLDTPDDALGGYRTPLSLQRSQQVVDRLPVRVFQ